MPRRARAKSNSGVYHVMLRGINHQVIFKDEEDRERLIVTLEKYKEISGYRLYAYCLMSNHFHLLLKVEKEELDLILKRIAGSYVYWYNKKHKRSGHLFQDRYRSEAVEDDRYFLAVLRYIHQNPVKAGLCKNAAEYKYSSYPSLLKGKSELLDKDYVFSVFGGNDFEEFHKGDSDKEYMDIEEKEYPTSDIDAAEIIKSVSRCKNLEDFHSLSRVQLDEILSTLKQKGLPIRQISRITGVGKGIVERA